MPARYRIALFASALVMAAACGGDAADKKPAANGGAAPAPGQTPDEYRKAQQRYADSVLNQTSSAAEVVKQMGGDYAVGSVRLRDTLALLAEKSGCFLEGRKTDPYLAGTVSFYVFMSVVGSTAVYVQENATKWTSQAGNIVNSCLNVAAKNWKFDPSFGKQASYITQVQFK
jgi:hypothetical protein